MMHVPQRRDPINSTLSSSLDLWPLPAPSSPPFLFPSVTLSASIWRPLHHPPSLLPPVRPLNKLSKTPVYREVFGPRPCTGCAHVVNKQMEREGKNFKASLNIERASMPSACCAGRDLTCAAMSRFPSDSRPARTPPPRAAECTLQWALSLKLWPELM